MPMGYNLIPQTTIELGIHVIVNSIAITLITRVLQESVNTEWKKRMVQILSIDPNNRRRVLKILLDHTDECGMSEESQFMLKECGDDFKADIYLKRLKNSYLRPSKK
jgi:hypothetical protein